MRFPPAFLDELRLRLPIADVVGRRVKLVRRGREHTGLCPFHNEKTPSFTVSEDKGFYHCFGCGAHGDVIKFVMETEHLGFPEAVERLAGEAGLSVPRLTPQEEEAQQRRGGLRDLMEAAAAWFEGRLGTGQGDEARRYIEGRGLSAETIATFRIGFAPRSRTALKEAMLARKFSEDQLVEAGLLIRREAEGEHAAEVYDRFRNRVMFPISDARGRVVAFGGRALGDAGAKYLNSPETPLFHKGRMLYNLAGARKSAIERAEVIVAEGYMDVIALHQAGFTNAVAPLGTALTEDQLGLLWRLAPEPTLCFDGDKAGLAAAGRALERALPLLKPGHSLRFALLPAGEDPDSLIRREGAGAFRRVLEAASPLSTMFWETLTAGADLSTPERRAGLEKKVFDALRAIADEKVRLFYQKEFRSRLNELMGPPRAQLGPRFGGAAGPVPGGRSRSAMVGRGGARGGGRGSGLGATAIGRGRDTAAVRAPMEELLVLTVLNHPQLLINHQEDFAAISLESAELGRLRDAVLEAINRISPLDREGLRTHLVEGGFDGPYRRLTESDAKKSDWSAWPGAALEDAEKGWLQTLKRHRRITELEREKKALEEHIAGRLGDANSEGDIDEKALQGDYDRLIALKAEIEANAGDESDIDGYGLASERGMNY